MGVQKQRKHSPTLCAPRHAFKLVHFWLFILLCACAHGISTNFVLSDSKTSDMNERGYYDENLILIENKYRENIFCILDAVKTSPSRTTTTDIFYDEKTRIFLIIWHSSILRSIMDMIRINRYESKKKRGECYILACNPCIQCSCSYFDNNRQ